MYKSEIRITVKSRIQKRAKRRYAPYAARHLPIGHIQKSRKKQNRRSLPEPPHGKKRRRPGIHRQTQKREHVRRDSSSRKSADDVAQQPPAAFADPVCRRLLPFVRSVFHNQKITLRFRSNK